MNARYLRPTPRIALLALGAVWPIAGCALELPKPPAGASDDGELHAEPMFDSGVAPAFIAHSEPSPPPLPRLFVGLLSDYHLARANDDELPSTLQQRLVPLWVSVAADEQQMVPLSALVPGGQYSLVTHPGRAIEFVTAEVPIELRRHWPLAGGGPLAVYCSDPEINLKHALLSEANSPGSAARSVLVERSQAEELADGTGARWEPLPGQLQCALLRATGSLPAGGAASGTSLLGKLAEPTLFVASRLDPPVQPATQCAAEHSALLLGCLGVADDRFELQSPHYEVLWVFEGDFSATLTTGPGVSAVVQGLKPASHYALTVRAYALDGTELQARPTLLTAPARPHVVLSEVLSNPLGAEPAQEWVEIVNDGAEPVELAGFKLIDSGGETLLPSASLAAGQYALIVNDKFDETPDWDLPPEAEAQLIRVPKLGTSGLSNAGEPLQLVTPQGQIVSRFAAQPKPAAGASLARTRPNAPDNDASSFAVSMTPTPGSANAF